ncbi:histamine H2 receptor-like [Tubulanus polymorphus]|uniref:histamine H2 receptor-like n=1 Tax=Tubulanus polymorphus TaxID=672921 RepID=UPI003DA34F42
MVNVSQPVHSLITTTTVSLGNLTTPSTTPPVEQTSYLEITVRAIIMVLICVASTVANTLVFVVFYKKQHWLLTISNRFILNLALTNFLMATLIMPFVLISTVMEVWVFGQAWCQITALLSTVLLAACILTLLLISFDRYCAVVTPLRYTMLVTPSSSNYALASVWVTSVVLSVPPIFGWNRFSYQKEKHSCTVNWKTITAKDRSYAFFFSVSCFYLPFILMIWIYCSILRASKETSARARRNSMLPDQTNQESGFARRRSSLLSRRGSALSFGRFGLLFQKDEWKTAKTSLLVMSAVTISWLPYFSLITIESSMNDPYHIPTSLETFAVWMALAGCAINPLVYFFRNSMIREEIPKIFLRRASVDSDIESRPRMGRRASESMISYYMNRRRSSSSTTGTAVTRLSASSLHSDESSAQRQPVTTTSAPSTGEVPSGWFPDGYFSRPRRSLDSMLPNPRLIVGRHQHSQVDTRSPLVAEVLRVRRLDGNARGQVAHEQDYAEVPFELPGEMPRELG